jgi:hypothetical protein
MSYFCQMKTLLLFLAFLPAFAVAQWDYHGTIGKDLKIWMRLETYADTAFGGYFYTSSGEEIKLYGKQKGEHYKLKEVNKDGKVTAIIEFKEVEPYIRYEGTWTPVDKKKKKLPLKIFMLPPNISMAGAPADPIHFKTDTIKYASTKDRYEITAYYPQFTFEDGYGIAQFNALTAAFARAEAERFLGEFKASDEDRSMIDSSINSEMFLSYMIYDTMGFVSVEFNQYIYYLGAAHGFPATISKSYSGRLHRWVTLADLFKTKANYLEALSKICIPAVMDSLRSRVRESYAANPDTNGLAKALSDIEPSYRDWVENGAAPREKNYRSFVPTKEGLWIIFDPYQVASYVDGPFEIFIPYKKLDDILAGDWEVRRWKKY